MNTVYITLPPPTQCCSQKSMLCEMSNNPRVNKCLIIDTSLPHDKVEFGDTHTEEPYGIDIRHRACALQPLLSERKKNWHKFFLKGIIPNQSNHAM